MFDTNPAVQTAWDYVGQDDRGRPVGAAAAFSDEWNAGFKNGIVRRDRLPRLDDRLHQGQSGEENAGKWDIATVPGGGGNWGGSWLAVPTSSKHQDMALELIEFLSNEEGQMMAFEAEGRLPSCPRCTTSRS